MDVGVVAAITQRNDANVGVVAATTQCTNADVGVVAAITQRNNGEGNVIAPTPLHTHARTHTDTYTQLIVVK